MLATGLAPGFADPVHEAQTVFRAVLAAMARPGRIATVAGIAAAPAPLTPEMAALALTLLDHETAFALTASLAVEPVSDYLAFHTGARQMRDVSEAAFVFQAHGDPRPALQTLNAGTPEYPDRSTTLIVGVADFAGPPVSLSGPGIAQTQTFGATGLDLDFWPDMQRNHRRYPLGIDVIFCAPGAVTALPRSTGIEV